ncbi:hypothetical protein GCM10023235_35600 [Kitasatospora terrestris]|uniref:Uncharacterized protein n=1 Tax=Kitasatospora terrestris TaxID=258051 RepID=A0ABP9DR39_9ACTN
MVLQGDLSGTTGERLRRLLPRDEPARWSGTVSGRRADVEQRYREIRRRS